MKDNLPDSTQWTFVPLVRTPNKLLKKKFSGWSNFSDIRSFQKKSEFQIFREFREIFVTLYIDVVPRVITRLLEYSQSLSCLWQNGILSRSFDSCQILVERVGSVSTSLPHRLSPFVLHSSPSSRPRKNVTPPSSHCSLFTLHYSPFPLPPLHTTSNTNPGHRSECKRQWPTSPTHSAKDSDPLVGTHPCNLPWPRLAVLHRR